MNAKIYLMIKTLREHLRNTKNISKENVIILSSKMEHKNER